MENVLRDFVLEKLNIPIIEERNYWLVRSNGGKYYHDFVLHDYIAIAWDYITLSIINEKSEAEVKKVIELTEESLTAKIEFTEEEISSGVVTSIYNKLDRFINEFKVGDIVLVPSRNSDFISIGTITSNVFEDSSYINNYIKENPTTELNLCPYHKRREVDWIKEIPKEKLDIYLTKAFNSQHAISQLNEYSEFIDRNIYPIYAKGEELHSTIEAGHPNGLTLKELAELSSNLELSLIDLCMQAGVDYNEKDYNVKINIHSPGLMELIGYGAAAGITISILMFALNHLINGGTFKIGFKKDAITKNTEFILESETKGIRGRELDFKEFDLKQQVELRKLAEDLEIKSPEFDNPNSGHKED